jgi:hypothetical protein
MTSAKSERSENAISGTKDAVGEEAEREAGEEVTTPNALAETVRNLEEPKRQQRRDGPDASEPQSEKEVSTPNAIAEAVRR